jgi:hypothetical protein
MERESSVCDRARGDLRSGIAVERNEASRRRQRREDRRACPPRPKVAST